MRDTADEEIVKKRLGELAARAERTDRACFTEFLTPPEAAWAQSVARKQGVSIELFGGYEDAERSVARMGGMDEPFPVTAVLIEWPRQSAPAHRDLLGTAMSLGFRRSCLGDIVLERERAFLFALSPIAPQLCDSITEAGRVRLHASLVDGTPELQPIEGEPLRDTISAPRLDAVLSSGFGLSRSKASELIAAGRVKLRHLPSEKPDARVGEGDAISLRGYGRLVVEALGHPTKKGRIPLNLIRYGSRRGR